MLDGAAAKLYFYGNSLRRPDPIIFIPGMNFRLPNGKIELHRNIVNMLQIAIIRITLSRKINIQNCI